MNDPIYNEATYNEMDMNECEYCGKPCEDRFCNDICRLDYANYYNQDR